jgi:hypothetical protein
MTASEVHAPILGESGEPCRECGAPLAADQRYCLHCGARRGEARLDHTVYTREAAPVAPAPVPPSPARSAGLTAVAGVATLLLAMGVGVLIGRAGRDDNAPTKAAAPQVITVSGAAAGAPAATTPAATTAAPKAAAVRHAAKKHASSDAGSSATKGSSHATNPALKQLQNSSGKNYSKQSQKLPKTLSTGGKAPPKDKKAPAGGGSFDTIG